MRVCERLKKDRHFRRSASALISLVVGIAYVVYNGYLGISSRSLWFVVMCVYHLLLILMRFFVLSRNKNGRQMAIFVGVCLILLAFCLGAINYLSESQGVIARHSTIPMITIAAYTFYKLTMSAVRAAKYHGRETIKIECINVIRYAEVAVSVLSMQRSMLVSFEGMSIKNMRILNVSLGSVVWAFIIVLGIYLIGKKENRHGRIKNCQGRTKG